jgi:cytochrome c
MDWLSQAAPEELMGQGVMPYTPPDRMAVLSASESLYNTHCQSCHSATGSGYQAMPVGVDGDYVAPPLWGYGSFSVSDSLIGVHPQFW